MTADTKGFVNLLCSFKLHPGYSFYGKYESLCSSIIIRKQLNLYTNVIGCVQRCVITETNNELNEISTDCRN